MNAFTASDWTAYPFATQNRQDYFNLLSVYLDATFFPNLNPLDFAQEGIRVELNEAGKPEFKGIVFNEMKGAMSGEVDQLYHTLAKHLFPTTTYHYNSGGEPLAITELTHQDLLDFHQSHYHPSNAVVMSFGNIELYDIQEKLHHDALCQFERGEKRQSMLEQSLPAPIHITETYSVDSIKSKQTHHVLAWLLPTIIDPKQRLALRLLEGILVEHAGSPLQAYLDSHPLASAPTPLLGLDDSHYHMVFYAGVRGSEPEYAKEIEQGILDLLKQVADNPIDPEAIETILHQIEIDQRHIGGDSMPYGLNLMLEGFSTVIHDGDPVGVWDIDNNLVWLQQQVKNPDFIRQLIYQHLLDNTHRVCLTLVPDANKSQQLADAEQAKLNHIEQYLTDEQRQILQNNAEALAERQATLDDVDLLPKVGLADIPTDIAFKVGQQKNVILSGQDSILYEYEAGTNGLYYYQLIIPLQGHDNIIYHPWLSHYLALISELGTKTLDARSFQALQARHSSGVTVRISQRTSIDNAEKLESFLVIATRSLSRKLEAIDLVKMVLNDSVFTEYERMAEILTQKQMGWQSRLSNAGHAYALQTASRNMSKQAQLEYARGGLPALNELTLFLANAEQDPNHWQQLGKQLNELHNYIKALPKQALIIAERQYLPTLQQAIIDSWALPNQTLLPSLMNHHIETDNQDTAWLIQTNVFHHAIAFSAVPSDHPDTPALMILAGVLRNNYLHRAIREKGGAYGGGASYDGNACAFKFYSYRDPRCEETFKDFLASIDWILEQQDNDKTASWIEEAILGLIAGMDKPNSPAGEAVKALFSELHGRHKTWQQQIRAKILAVTLADLQRVTTTYLKDKPFSRASLAPVDKADLMENLGFNVQKLR